MIDERARLFYVLADLLRAGVPLLEALEATRVEFAAPFVERLVAGSSFADALAADGARFPAFIVDAVREAERTGTLDQVCARIGAIAAPSSAAAALPAPVAAALQSTGNASLLEVIQEACGEGLLDRAQPADAAGALRQGLAGAAILIRAGFTTALALRAMSAAAPSSRVRDGLTRLANAADLHESLASSDLLHPAAARLVLQAERAGRLDDAFLTIARGLVRGCYRPRALGAS